MITTGTTKVTLPTDEQILITRDFAAPAHLLYRAHTEPELVRRWWAGRRGTVTVAEIDLRVGGRWRFVMDADGGFEVGFHGEYLEIVPDERLVMSEVYEGAPAAGEPVRTTYRFDEADGRTRLSMLMEVGSKADRDMILETGMESGIQEQMELLDGLAVELAGA